MTDAPSYAVGWQEPVYIPNPAAGSSFTYTADGRYYERVVALSFALTTSAVVANRFAQMYLEDTNGTVITSVPCGATVVASQTLDVFLTNDAPSYSNGASGGTFGLIPGILIPPGWKWVCTVSGQDAGDTVTQIVALVQRFPNDAAVISAVG
jgi:hypothetical protein